jgi:uncharacterized surface anchored protein
MEQGDAEKPIAGAIVTAFAERPVTDGLISTDELYKPFSAKTDENGFYKIENIPSGKYIVSADAEGYLREYWEEAASLDEADPVEVPESGGKENINFTLEKGGAISGTVKVVTDDPSSEPRPLPGALVQVWRRDSNAAIGRARTNQDGHYRIDGLPSGEYIAFANAEGFKGIFYDSKESREEADAIKVEAPNVTEGINFVLQKIDTRGAAITGVVISQTDKNPIPHATVLAIPLRSSGGLLRAFFTMTDAFGRYKLGELPAGKYVALSCAGGFLCEFYDNAPTFAAAKIITLESGEVMSNIDFSLTPARRGPYRIAGRVRNAHDNRGVANSIVQALTGDAIVATALTDANGQFTIEELPAGDYKLFASSEFGSAYYGGANEQAATPVTVGNGQNAGNLELSIVDSPTSVEENSEVPTRFELEPNYPNPFNPETSIKYHLASRTSVTLRIYNALGQEVRTLVNGIQNAGSYKVQWDGKDNKGRGLSAGIYLFRLEAADFVMTRKMAMVK